MHSISHYQELISSYFSNLHLTKEPKNLYEPIEITFPKIIIVKIYKLVIIRRRNIKKKIN